MSQAQIESDRGRTTRPVRLVPDFEVRRIPRPRPVSTGHEPLESPPDPTIDTA